jgi:hypothetical protein
MIKETTDVQSQQSEESTTLKRRGVLAAAWALVAGVVVKETVQPVSASASMQIASTETAGVTNPVVGPSTIASQAGFTSTSAILIADASASGPAVALAAIHGASLAPTAAPEPCGVYGQGSNFSAGVVGTSNAGAAKAAIHGIGTGGTVGVQAESTSTSSSVNNYAVLATVPAASSAPGIAVYGVNRSTYTGGGPGAGGFGLYGLSSKGHGLVGATETAGGAAVVGATNGVAGAYAAVFYGPVVVTGSFSVVGAKNAAVPHPDGTHRLLYSIESPESWFEDFGEAQLTGGKSEVTLDPDFGAVADLAKYHVFLTEYDGHNALYVTKRTANGFSVHAKDGAGAGRFSWRVVAKRKDIAGERLAKIAIPPAPELPSSAEIVEPMHPQQMRSRHQRGDS